MVYARTRACERKAISMTPVSAESESIRQFGYIRDISSSGMSMFGLKPLVVGKSLKVRFSLAGTGITVDCKANVRWNSMRSNGNSTVCCHGLMFEDVEPDIAAKLDNWVQGGSVRYAA